MVDVLLVSIEKLQNTPKRPEGKQPSPPQKATGVSEVELEPRKIVQICIAVDQLQRL